MQADDFGHISGAYSLNNDKPMSGTLAQCEAACVGDCVAFSWRVGVDPATPHPCYLKRTSDRAHVVAGDTSKTWTTFITSCGGGLASRGDYASGQTLWVDTDGFPYTTDTSGHGSTGVLWSAS